MTKKKTSSAPKKSPKKKGNSRSFSVVVSIAVILVIAFVGNQLGLIDSTTFEEILEELTTEEVVSGQFPTGAEPHSQDEGQIQFTTVTPAPKPTALGGPDGPGWYQIYFSSPQYPDTPDTRIDTIAQPFIQVIDSAQSSLDIAIFELNLDQIGDALLAARDRGVRVRLVTDDDELEELETLIRLEKAGIPIIADDRGALMHNKFAVIDGQAVWTGSWNFTSNGAYRNNNHAILIQSPELAQNYTAEFEEMFAAKQFGPTSPVNTPHPRIILDDTLIETCFAPEDECADQIIRLVRQAQNNIRFIAFSFTHDGIGKAVRDRANDGLLIEGVFETRGSDTDASEYARLRRKKLNVLRDGNPYTLHHKIFIIDDETVVLGSFNFTDNANDSNDENMLMIHNPTIAAHFLAEFDRVYAQAAAEQE